MAQAIKEGIHIPDKFRPDGQLDCEAHALTRYTDIGFFIHSMFHCVYAHCRCRHKNLVELLGFCRSPPMLLYEYMENGNLYDRLFKVSQELKYTVKRTILFCSFLEINGTVLHFERGSSIVIRFVALSRHFSPGAQPKLAFR